MFFDRLIVATSFGAEAGHYALALATIAAFLQLVVGLYGAARNDARLMAMTPRLALTQLIALAIAFAALISCAVTDDFSLSNIVENSARDKPVLYKITGVWGNHEGSILLWALILGICGAAVTLFGRQLPTQLKTRVIAVLGGVSSGFLLFCVTTSNPFQRTGFPLPQDGMGMNPLLQDPGLAFHPPILYTGYVGFAVPFAFAIAALISGQVDAAWGRWVRPWALAAWCFLTCGIALGSWWSYYVLGWGGYWFWDPVENASLIPWLAGTALVHSSIVVEKREALRVWTVLLAIATFSFSLSGTFLVRSGILNSVHAFANDPARGVFILILLAVVIGTAFVLFAWRAPMLQDTGMFAPVSREGALIINNILLCTLCAIVLIGTMYPPFMQLLTGRTLSVGKPFFDATTVPLMLPLMGMMVVGPFLAWKRAQLRPITARLRWTFVLIVPFVLLCAWRVTGLLPILCASIAIWLILGTGAELIGRLQIGITSLTASWQRARGLPASAYGTALAHIGVGITVLGITGMSQARQHIEEIAVGGSIHFNGYEWHLTRVNQMRVHNYDAETAEVIVSRAGHVVTRLNPSKHIFPLQRQTVTDVAIHTNLMRDLYCVLGDSRQVDGRTVFVLRLHDNPLAPWIWLGGLVMAVGGALSLWDRRQRLGVPQPARRDSVTEAGS